MIRLPGVRDKGPGPLLGASRDGDRGPFGIRGQDGEDDDRQDHEQPDTTH